MRRSIRLVPSVLALVCGVVLAATLIASWAEPARAAYGGLSNPSFETAPPPATPTMVSNLWTILSSPIAGNVAMRQKDASPEYPVFAGLNGGTTVTPRTGSWMLRFGMPKDTNSHQVKGITKVSQTFDCDGTDIGVAFRVFTWEHNDTDAFIIDVKDATGKSVGRLADKEIQDITATKVVTGTGAMPYTLDLHVEPRQVKYMDSGWRDVRITGLPTGQLTISFTLDTNTTAAHDSWVYLDLADILPPTTTANGAPPATAGWNNGDVTVTLNPVDDSNGSGVDKTYWRIDGGAQQTYGPICKPVLTTSAQTLTYWSIDKAGNIEAAKSFSAKIDRVAPTVSVAGNLAGWNKDPVTLTFAATAGPSGIASVEYKVDAGSWTTIWPGVGSYQVIVGIEGQHTVGYRATSVAGTKSAEGSCAVNIDITPPAFAPGKNPSTAWTNQQVTVTAGASDSGGSGLSGDISYTVKQAGQPDRPGAGGTAMIDAAGTYAVTFTTTDKAGNSATSSPVTVQIDRSAPSGTVTINGGDAWTNSTDVTLALSNDDGSGSGVAAMRFANDSASLDSASWVPYADTRDDWRLAADDGTKTVYVQLRDTAGNVSTAITGSIGLDTVRPADGSVQINGGGDGWTRSQDVTLTLSATDGGSGVSQMQFKNESGVWSGWTDYATSRAWTLSANDGEKTVHVQFKDAAGNVTGMEISDTIGLDATQPTIDHFLARNGTQTPFNRPVFEFSATDGGASIACTAQVERDGQVFTAATSGEALPVPVPEGLNTLIVTAQDAAGNIATRSYDFTVALPDHPFTVKPDNQNGYEGYTFGLYADDTSATGNADGSWEGKKWEWRVTTPALDVFTLEGAVRFVALPEAADYHVQLTVTDTGTTAAPGTGAKCQTEQTVHPQQQKPWVSALNIDVLDGQPARLVARYLDPGWEQTHDVTWSIDDVNSPISKATYDDHDPSMNSGYAEGTTTQPLDASHGQYDGHLTVTDSSQASTGVDFKVNPVAPNPLRDEGLAGSNTITTPASSPILTGGQVHLSYIQSANDVDFFEVVAPNGDPLPYGAEVLVTLRDLPADYDIALVNDLADGAATNPSLESSSFMTASVRSYHASRLVKPGIDWADSRLVKPGIGWLFSRLVKPGIPVEASSYLDSRLVKPGIPVQTIRLVKPGIGAGNPDETAFVRSPLLSWIFTQINTSHTSLDGWSFLDMDFTGLGNNTASGTSMSFAQLGFTNQDTSDMRIVDFSAHAGTDPEVVYMTKDFVGGHTYIAIKGSNGAYSDTQPYAVQVETSLPLDTTGFINDGSPAPDPVVTTGNSTTQPVDPDTETSAVSQPLTLFVTQTQRIDALYPGSSFDSAILPELRAVCANDLVCGEVISVPSTYYDAWDAKPWDTVLANDVAKRIRGEVIQPYLKLHPSIKYVVLVGSDDVIPQRRVQDQTTLGNERSYVNGSNLKTSSSLLASMLGSTVLTDDYYVDAESIPFNGRSLYIPDISVSRLVETPDEIAGEVQRFIDSGGRLSGGSSIVTGQDFMTDGAQRVESILSAAGLSPVDNIANEWKKSEFWNNLPAGGADVASVNAHFLHYGGISGYGYHHLGAAGFDLTTELLSGKEISDSTQFLDKLVFTMGCHAGLNVPDRQVDTTGWTTGQPDPRLDIAQAMARQQGVLVASTGYGFGDDAGISGTEALIGTFADQATTADGSTVAENPTTQAKEESGQPIGLALAEAKRQYLTSLTSPTAFDEKSSIEFTMYGMPQYRLECTTHAPVATGERYDMTNVASASLDIPTDTLSLTILDGSNEPKTMSVPLYKVTTVKGSYFTADGDAQATADRPIQPRVVIDLGQGGSNPVHSAIFTPGDSIDHTDFDPVISRWTTEWEPEPDEFQVSADGWWPAPPATVRTIGTGAAREQKLIVLPAQFLTTSAQGDATVTGTERVWRSMTVELVRGPESDSIAPTVHTVGLSHQGDAWTATVAAEDASGIARIVVTPIGVPGASPTSRTWAPASHDSSLTVPFAPPSVNPASVTVTVTVVDGAGNATTMTGKNRYITLPPSGTATVNDGSSVTYSSLVTLKSQVTEAAQMRISTDDVNWTGWRSYAGNVRVALPGLPGDKTVWVEYRNWGAETLDLSFPIRLESPQIAAGSYHSAVIKSDGSLWAWGMGTANGHNNDTNSPGLVDSGPWAAISAGNTYSTHNLVVGPSGGLSSWGPNDYGELGRLGGSLFQPLPVDGTDWAQIAANGQHSMAVKTDRTLWAWGRDNLGQLGIGVTGLNQTTPIQVGNASDWASVAAGNEFSLALKTDGSLFAWGDNGFGQLGDGSVVQKSSPVRVGNGTDWVAIAAGLRHSLALKADGSLYAWGGNDTGQLGDGTTADKHSPTRIGNDNDWVAIAAGGGHSLALKADGSLYAWGWNNEGQLGVGDFATDHTQPTRVGNDNDWLAISGGWWHSLALKSDGSLYAWGKNANGQLGIGAVGDTYTSPTLVTDHVVDITPPTTTASGADSAWHSAAVTVVLTAQDSGSDVARTEYRVDGGTWTSGASVTVSASANDGIHTVSYRSVDNAGNVEIAKSVSVKIDAHPPVTSVDAPSGWQNTPVTVHLRASDGLSGVAETDYYLDSSPWTTGTSVFVGAPVDGTNDGQHVIWYHSHDNAGNQESSQLRLVQIDATQPTATITSPADGTVTGDQTPQLLFSAADTHLTGTIVRVDGNVVTKNSGDDLDLLADGQHTVTATATDAAGNTRTATSTFTVDTAAPTGTITLNGDSAQAYAALVSLDSSQVTGATDMRTSTDYTSWSPWRPYAASSLVALPGLPGAKKVWAQYRDQGFNVFEQLASVTLAPEPMGAGPYQSLTSKSDGTLWAWGTNGNGQLGDGTTADKYVPTEIGSATNWVSVSGGYYHSLALQSDGTLWAWGRNNTGQLGDGTTTESHAPKQVGSATDWVAVSGGSYHSLALKSDGTLWAWGSNNYGQLGDGSTTDSHVPAQIGGATNWVAVSCGYFHSLAVKSDGTLWTWGRNDVGQLGDTSTTDRHAPVQVGGATDWVAVIGGSYHSLALKSDGTLWAWGDNYYGQLGDTSTTDRHAPVQVGSATDWVAISGGSDQSHALKCDGALWAWGRNNYGQLGDTSTTDRHAPVQVGSATDWAAVSGGTAHFLALKRDGTLCALGRNNFGQLGDGTTTDSRVPERILFSEFTTIAGAAGVLDEIDGTGGGARFRDPWGIACDAAGNMYVADENGNRIRKVTPDGVVTTFAGPGTNGVGHDDGLGAAASFWMPHGVACDPSGNVYVADSQNNIIRKITPAGLVSTFAGTAGQTGSTDATGAAAKFSNPTGVACDAGGNVYVADTHNQTIRKITTGGVVTTLAGTLGASGSADANGTFASFNFPTGLACDAAGNVYVADYGNSTIRKITPGGAVTTLAGSAGHPSYVDGTGTAAGFSNPGGVACDAAGNVFVADTYGETIRKVTPAGVVTTIGGSPGLIGSSDGAGNAAKFYWPHGIACDAFGNVYVADTYNCTIRALR